MGMIEEKWNALFETYGIAEQVKRQGIFSITADQIREFKEPRLCLLYTSDAADDYTRV